MQGALGRHKPSEYEGGVQIRLNTSAILSRDRMQRQGAEDGAKNQVPDPAGAKVEVEVLLPDRAMLV